MDDPGMSLFQGKGLDIVDNNENQEEAEDLEEQIRRREELQNLLINALDEFKYDDSTMNSSTNISVASAEYIDQAYKDVQTPYEQLKLLYDIRMKEIQTLKGEFDDYKENMGREMDSLKRRLTLQEAETSQVEISLRNTKSLLVEKTDIIATQEKNLAMKDEEIGSLQKTVEQLEFDVQAYKSTVEELQLKFAMETGPFNVAARVFNVEELQNNHKEQIEKLEAILEEQRRKIEILEKDRIILETDLKRTIENSSENESLQNNTIKLLNDNIESAQNQCKDLLNLVEMLTKENEHYRNRIHKFESSEPILLSNSFKRKSLDYDTLVIHNERLKKMLLDKDVELTTLKSKTRFYENDVKELLEYRKMKNLSFSNIQCNQPEHSRILCVAEHEMRKLQDSLVEKQQEIDQLTSINVELEDKIENMIKQTRSDLQNLSNKYKLPELETMSEELLNAEEKIKELQQKLEASEAEIESLKSNNSNKDLNNLKLKLQESEENILSLRKIIKEKEENNENRTALIEQNNMLKSEKQELLKIINDLEHYKTSYELLYKEYSQLSEQLKELGSDEKVETRDLSNLREDLENFWSIYDHKPLAKKVVEVKIGSWINQVNSNCILMRKLKESESKWKKEAEESKVNLKESEKEVEKLTELIEELNNTKIFLEGEKKNAEIRLKNIENTLNGKIAELDALTNELNIRNKELADIRNELDTLKNEDKNVTMRTLEDASQHLEEAKSELLKYQEALNEKCDLLKKYEVQVEQLQIDVKNTNESLESSRKEVEELQTTIKELLEDKIDKRTGEDGDKCAPEDDSLFKVKLLKAEVSIQEKLRKEYERKVSKIEETYKNIFDANQQKLNRFKEQERLHRDQLSEILNKYAQIMSPVQKENAELKERLGQIEVDYVEMKKFVEMSKNEYNFMIQQIKRETEGEIDAWKKWAKSFVQACLNLEKTNAQSRNTVLNSLKECDLQVQSIDRYFDEKIKQYKKKYLAKTK
ncbi:myosin-1-like [Coccinella septempunctata]|uniref:myosin-1-like n=1 Tax=Coccinella septempunctata TaxID=41139 RepID=UPI001D0970F1|nr:myosin-1-like [Coccinella septempunctata]